MNGHEDIDALAAEYVLGTLDAEERRDFAARRSRERQVDEAIAAWERRLGPLSAFIPPATPRRDLLPEIKRRIGLAAGESAALVDLRRSHARWRAAAAAVTALAACLAVFIAVREIGRATMPTAYVAVLQKDAESPAFLLTLDTKTGMVSISPVAASPMPNNSYELWLVHKSLPAPRSLGLISQSALTVKPTPIRTDHDLVMNATYAVSVEPEGGSPTGEPTGPVVYTGKLWQATK